MTRVDTLIANVKAELNLSEEKLGNWAGGGRQGDRREVHVGAVGAEGGFRVSEKERSPPLFASSYTSNPLQPPTGLVYERARPIKTTPNTTEKIN